MTETTTRRRIQTRWSDVHEHMVIELKGELFTPVSIKTKGDKLKVTIRNAKTGAEFTSKVNPAHGVDVIELVTRREKSWTKPDDQDEANIVEGLGAKIVGVKPAAGELWIVPNVDVSTVAAHLYIFHGIDPAASELSGQAWIQQHQFEHDTKTETQLFEPHRHEAGRPVVEIGPRFT